MADSCLCKACDPDPGDLLAALLELHEHMERDPHHMSAYWAKRLEGILKVNL